MSPKDFQKIESEQNAIIEAARRRIATARAEAEQYPAPRDRRPASEADLHEGAIIWHERAEEHGGDYWHIVVDPRLLGNFRDKYTADDGCCHTLDGAYVDLSNGILKAD